MSMRIRSIISLLGLALGLAACGRPETAAPAAQSQTAAPARSAQSQTAPPARSAQYSWLHEAACRPPCWEGITPGVTTVTATAELLRASPTIRAVSVHDLAAINYPGEHEIRWVWTPPGTMGGYAYAFNGSFIIDHVGLSLDAPVTFAAVQERFGPPSHAVLRIIPDPHSNDVTWKLELIYVDLGMILAALSPTPPQLETAPIDLVLFTQADTAHIDSHVSAEIRYPWQDGAALSTYCSDEYAYERCLLLR
jgi:hypothetical protein